MALRTYVRAFVQTRRPYVQVRLILGSEERKKEGGGASKLPKPLLSQPGVPFLRRTYVRTYVRTYDLGHLALAQLAHLAHMWTHRRLAHMAQLALAALHARPLRTYVRRTYVRTHVRTYVRSSHARTYMAHLMRNAYVSAHEQGWHDLSMTRWGEAPSLFQAPHRPRDTRVRTYVFLGKFT